MPDWVLFAILESDLVVFGQAIRGDTAPLLQADARYRLERARNQSIHPLLAALWRGRLDEPLRARVEARIVSDLVGVIDAPGRASSMDHALQGIGIVLVLAAAGSGRIALAAEAQSKLQRRLAEIIGVCFSDPEYSGNLSNNHHLTCAASLVVLLASVERNARMERMIRIARGWVRRAVRVQFGADGANFEGSSGYHMFCLEMLALTALADRETADDDAVRGALVRAQAFACAILREDGSYPMVGDFDGGRVLRLCNRYLPEPASTRRFSLDGVPPVDHGPAKLEIRFLDHPDSDAPAAFVAALAPHGLAPMPEPPVGRAARRRTAPKPVARPGTDADRLLVAGLVRDGWPAPASWIRYEFGAGFAGFERVGFFKSAGMLVAEGDGVHLVLRSGKVGQRGIGTHSHLDTLSLEVWTRDGAVAVDPGSRTYRHPESLRRRYRSAAVHFTPLWAQDLAVLDHPFALLSKPPVAKFLSGPGMVGGLVFWKGELFVRVVRVDEGKLVVVDAASGPPLEAFPFPDLDEPLATYLGPLAPRPDEAALPMAPRSGRPAPELA